MRSVRLCLECNTAHGVSLYSNRGHEKIECTNPWHEAGDEFVFVADMVGGGKLYIKSVKDVADLLSDGSKETV